MVSRMVFVVLALLNLIPAFPQSFTSSNLPIIVIDTQGQTILDEPKIGADMGIIDNGPGVRNNVSDVFDGYDGRIGIELRGSTSQMFPKKQYGIELHDAAGVDINASLLGMPEEEDWVLFAPYDDKSLIRDALAYKLGRDMGRYAPRARFCEVLLNGSYEGVYVLLEKVKRDKARVDIAKLNPDEVSGDDLTGGYLIKIDKSTGNGGDGWASPHLPFNAQQGQKIFFQYEYPGADEIVPEQKQYIQQYVAAFEDALAGPNYRNLVNGYPKYIDVDSFVDYYLISELTKNVDGYRLSTFLYKEKDSDGGRVHMGPIWDFNLGFGNADYCTQGNPEGFVTSFNSICPQDPWQIPFWWARFFQDPNFVNKVNTRWDELRSGPFDTNTILAHIDSVAAVLDESEQRNFVRWPVLGKYVWPNYYVGDTYEQEISWLKNWIVQRLNWMDNYIPDVVTAIGEEPVTLAGNVVYPNPFEQSLTFGYTLTRTGYVSVELLDLMGRNVAVYDQGYRVPGEYKFTIDTNAFPEGMYVYHLKFDRRQGLSGKLVKR
jgi:CotH kinase protein/Secretion system C-terminal sorting domain